jgi:hypothetical protein
VFRNVDAHRKKKEADVQTDIQALANNLASSNIYSPTSNPVMPAPPSRNPKAKGNSAARIAQSAVVDVYEQGL